MIIKRNKGELSEIYALLRIILDRLICYGDVYANATNNFVQVFKIHLVHTDIELGEIDCIIYSQDGKVVNIPINQVVTDTELQLIFQALVDGVGTFENSIIDDKVILLGMNKSKGTSYEKADVIVSLFDRNIAYYNQNISIKSLIGSKPSLLNASKATRFVYRVNGLTPADIEEINSINTSGKIKERMSRIISLGGTIEFDYCDNSIYGSTLRKVDTNMPLVLADALKSFFLKETGNRLSDFIEVKVIDGQQKEELTCRLKDFVKSTMLGIFPTKIWNGDLTAVGVVLVRSDGELIFYHTNQDFVLKNFFYKQTIFDTPSTSRHDYGYIYSDEKGKSFIKLCLQLRLSDIII